MDLELVASNRLEISYTNTAPTFAVNQYVCNLTPARPEDIFNRKITSLTDNPTLKRLTLYTVEVPLTEIATNGSACIAANSVILQTGTNGAFIKTFEIGGTITFPRIGWSLDGTEFKLKDANDFELVKLTLDEMHWWLTPRLQASVEVNWGQLKRFEAIASGTVEAASVWEVDFLLAGIAVEKTLFDLPEALEPKTWLFLGAIGPVPVFASLGFDAKLKARAEVDAMLNFNAGVRQTMDASFGLTYTQSAGVQWVNTFNFPPPEVIPFTANITVEGSLGVSFEPALEFLIYGLAGVSAGITPSGDITFETGIGQPLSGRLDADVTLDLGLAGPAFELLSPKPELSLSLWHDEWHLFPDDPAIVFTQQPQSQTAQQGGSAYFFCTVTATGTPAYQWYFNGIPMSGQTARTLSIPSVGYGHAGNYHVRVSAGSQQTNSAPATLTVASPSTPPNMALIPAGSFRMGATTNMGHESYSDEVPQHTVYVSAFYMDKYEVTKALWDAVKAYNAGNGYSFDYGDSGLGKAANHPAHTMTWYDAVKWCNARSQKEGRVPCYYTDAGLTTIYKTGQVAPYVKWSANGYRLPTEAEWEKAARGGASGHRFPWSDSDTIQHSRANYHVYRPSSTNYYAYDTSPTAGYHPTFNNAGYPYTSPAGYFAPNAYGLYDMAGNVWEWCWDWYGAYSSESQTDPRGVASSSYRVLRGGSWYDYAYGARCAHRYYGTYPGYRGSNVGFRCVLVGGSVP